MNAKVINILDNVQAGSFNHQKNIKLLEKVYNSVPFEEFLEYFLTIIQSVIQENYKNPCFQLLSQFLAKFVGHIASVHSKQNDSSLEDDSPTHPFLTAVIQEVVRYHNLPITECRYNACNFVSQTLDNITDRTPIDGQILDLVQAALLENIQDVKPIIRLQAVSALVRLQDPLNPQCPVINAYIVCLRDVNPLVRKEATKRIAPNALTIPKLKDKTADKDANVRGAAFTRVADIGIKYFKIVRRQFILRSGFSETNPHVKKIFLQYLLPKWLTALNGEYIAFLTAIKLDAEEQDILNTEDLSKKIMEVFFQTEPILNLTNALPLDDDKVIPLNSMKSEIAHYWNILTKFLRQSEETDDYLNSVIPELTSFCNYLEKLINTKFSKAMEDWEHLNFQYTLYQLFDIAEHYDLSEEVGRRTLDNLIKKLLRNHRLQPRLLSKIIQIGTKLSSSIDSFTNEMCLIISDIREPLIEPEPSAHEKREKEFKMAELTVKLNILQGDLEDAIDEKEFEKAEVLKNEIEVNRRKFEALSSQFSQVEKVRVAKDDPETTCWCLDLLSAVLAHSNLKTLSPSLVTCREEFLKPLIQSENVEIAWRVFKCLAEYCVFDKKMAEEYVKELMVPIASYRVIPDFNKTVLIVSVSIITDLIRLYGSKLFSTEADQNATSATQTSTRRRLYTQEVDDVGTICNQMSVDVIVNVFLDMLDDENDEIRNTAIAALGKLILNNEFTINPMIMTRLILKWYNPATQKILQQKLGIIFNAYTERIKNSKEIVAKSVVPILTNIADAPKTSPLAEVDIDNVIKFLTILTDSGATNGIVHIHRELAHTLIREIGSRPADVVTLHLAKMLSALNIAPDNAAPTKELIAQSELLLEREALDKGPKLHVTKFIRKLNGNLTMTNSVNTTTNTTNIETTANTTNNTVARRLSQVIEEHDEEIRASENEEDKTEENNKEIRASEKEDKTKENNKDIPSKKRRTNSRNRNERFAEDSTATDEDNQERSPEPQSDAVETVAPLGKSSELSEKPTQSSGADPDVISPSISPDSQEQTINNLRKRARSSSNAQTAQTKKKKVNTEEAKKSKSDKKEDPKNNKKDKEADTEAKSNEEVEANSGRKNAEDNAGSSGKTGNKAKNKENKQRGAVKKGSENKEDKSKTSKKNENKGAGSKPTSDSGSSESQTDRRCLRVVVSNIVSSDTARNNDKVGSSSDKEKSSESQNSVETSSISSDSSRLTDKEQPKASGKQHLKGGGAQKSAGGKNGQMLRKQVLTDNDSTGSEPPFTKKPRRPRRGHDAVRQQNKSPPNKITRTRSQSLEIVMNKARNVGTKVLHSSASQTSLNPRRGLRSGASTPVIDKDNRLRQGENNKVNSGQLEKRRPSRPKKVGTKGSQNESSSESLSQTSESGSAGSQSEMAENRLGARENSKAPVIQNTGNKSSRPSLLPDKQGATGTTKGPQKTANDNRTASASSVNCVDEIRKGRRGVKKGAKGLNNNKVGGKEVRTRANGVQKSVQKSVNTPQVKRKKARGAKDESTRELYENLSDSSDQSLHTIVDPSEIQMSLLPDSPENGPHKSIRNSRRLQVVVETSSDSESASSPVRKPSRKKKVYNRPQ